MTKRGVAAILMPMKVVWGGRAREGVFTVYQLII
jgi:hypothetical protein